MKNERLLDLFEMNCSSRIESVTINIAILFLE